MARVIGYAALAAMVGTVPAANYMVAHVGTVCVQNGPCLIPVLPGVLVPSGVAMAGIALVLRDVAQVTAGRSVTVVGIIAGAALSWAINPSLAVASAVAFLVAELLDMAVFTSLLKRGVLAAAFVSGVVGIVADSILFLGLAFGSLDHLLGQVVGKSFALLAALPLLFLARRKWSPSYDGPRAGSAAHQCRSAARGGRGRQDQHAD